MEEVKNTERALWVVYVIENESGKYYTGITTDLNRRMAQHLNKTRGARFFHFSPPKVCVFLKHCDNRSEALKLESKIKKMSRKQKEVMIQNG